MKSLFVFMFFPRKVQQFKRLYKMLEKEGFELIVGLQHQETTDMQKVRRHLKNARNVEILYNKFIGEVDGNI